jgi:hypothetical protein
VRAASLAFIAAVMSAMICSLRLMNPSYVGKRFRLKVPGQFETVVYLISTSL